MKAFMYMVGYDQKFIETCKTGWGCGYVAIPESYRSFKKHFERIKAEEENEDEFNFFLEYFEVIKFEQEITLTDTRVINGDNYLIIGFDTAHSYNNSSHDFNYVHAETAKILKLVEDYE